MMHTHTDPKQPQGSYEIKSTREWKERFDYYDTAIEAFTRAVATVRRDSKKSLRSASLDYSVDFATKIGSWMAYVRWFE